MKDFLQYGERMINNFVGLVQEKDLAEFEWKWPKHLDTELGLREEPFIKQIRKWFKDYCMGNPARKKAL